MKTNIKTLLCTLICILISTAAVAKGNIVWKNVETGITESGFTFRKVEFTSKATIVHFDFKQDVSFMFPHHTRLITDQGEELTFVKAVGVQSDIWIKGTKGKAIPVAMHFAPAKQPVKWLHYFEGKGSDEWKTFFIREAGTKVSENDVPSIFKNIKYDDNEILPTTKFCPTPARLHIYTNTKSLDMEASTFVYGFGDVEGDSYTFEIKNGEGTLTAQLFFPRTQEIIVGGKTFPCIMEPGKDAYCYVDLSKNADDKGDVLFAGHMAKTNQELVDKKLYDICEIKYTDPSYLCTTDTLLSIDQRLDMIETVFKNKIDSINNGKYSDNVKPLLRMNAEISRRMLSYNYGGLLLRSNKFKLEEIRDKVKSMLPIEKAGIKLQGVAQEYEYSPYATLCPGFVNLSGLHNDPDGKENTYLKELSNLSSFLKDMSVEDNIKFITVPEMLEYAKERKVIYQAKMDSLKDLQKADAIHFKEFDNVAPEAILDTIINHYKGKTILIDIWATWCGPCRQGHKNMAPMKEDMKDKSISFVYITSPTSPEGTWRNMITEISGDHYYLTQDQYAYILNKYNSEGIPTYIIFDKEGNSQYSHIGLPSLDELRNEINKAMK